MRSDVCEHERRVAQRDVRFAVIGEPRRTRAPVSVHVRRRPGRARSSQTDRLVAAVVIEIASLLAAATPLLFFVNDWFQTVDLCNRSTN